MCTRLNRLGEAVLTNTHNLFFEQKYENYQDFSSENFQFLVVKISVYLNRHVFVMIETCTLCIYLSSNLSHNRTKIVQILIMRNK